MAIANSGICSLYPILNRYIPTRRKMRFKSSRPDHLKQGLMAIAVSPFLLWVTNEGQIS